jgi:hypothetical protein
MDILEKMMDKVNFIQVSLCDNDFGWTIADALRDGVDNFGYDKKLCPFLWKKFIIAYVVGYHMRNRVDLESSLEIDWKRAHSLEEYLKRIKVTYEQKRPTDDDDSGSAYYDFNLKEAYTY